MIEQVYPPARSMGISNETEIWAQFAEPLDPATVNEQNVRLRVDTGRIPAAVSWEPEIRRIHIRPSGPLMIRRTHTVELRSGITTADGRALGHTYQWQFTTFSVRRPGTPLPADGTWSESPFVTLFWDSTESSPGMIAYELFAGKDSERVATRALPAVSLDRAYYVPRRRWGSDSTTYWSVTAVNRSTGDSLEGPVWSFHTLPPDAPVETIMVPVSDWGDYDVLRDSLNCLKTTFTAGGGRYNAAVRWRTNLIGPRKVASAKVSLRLASAVFNPGDVALWYATGYWSACTMGVPGPPFTEPGGQLTTNARLGDHVVVFTSDFLTAHIEASLRRPGFYGYVVRGGQVFDFVGADSQMSLEVYREGQYPRP